MTGSSPSPSRTSISGSARCSPRRSPRTGGRPAVRELPQGGPTTRRSLLDAVSPTAMSDWRSYDEIAAAYEGVWASRFESVARHLLAMVRPAAGTRLLDVGTGLGAVVNAADSPLTFPRPVGCDLSVPMLVHARRRIPPLRAVVADATRLPFRDGSFDLATANCVLSHLRDHGRALREVVRVLARPSAFAAACWGTASDAYAAAWKELLEGVVG